MSDSASHSTVSLESGNSEVSNSLDSIFKSCLNALSPDEKKDTPMPALFKILAMVDKSCNREKSVSVSVAKEESISSLINALPVVSVDSNSSTTYSHGSEFSVPSSDALNEELNPQKIGSSIFYDSSDKGDTLTPWHVQCRRLEADEESGLSAYSLKPLVEPMSGDCLFVDPKFRQDSKIPLPIPNKAVVHEVYYSIASTNIAVSDNDGYNDGFQPYPRPSPPTNNNNNSPISDVEGENGGEHDLLRNGNNNNEEAAAGDQILTIQDVKLNEVSSNNDSESNSSASAINENNNKVDAGENALKLTASASPIEFSIPDFLNEDAMISQDENISLCLRQLVGTNISLTPRSPALARKYSEDFSNLFY